MWFCWKMENEIRKFKRRVERDFALLDLFFIPSSLVRLKLEGKKEKYWHYIPILFIEGLRLYGYYRRLENYLR